MNGVAVDRLERRLLVFAPVGKDSRLIEATLAEGDIDCQLCADMAQLAAEVERGAAALLIAEEAFVDHDGSVGRIIARQPSWSDLPVLLLTRHGADSPAVSIALERLGNVTLIERPVRMSALTSAVRSALRARERQYLSRAHLEERDRANRSKDEFLATLAHELRNPLAPIRNSLTLLRDGSDTALACDVMERQVSHMVRLVDDLLEVSRLTSGRIELRRETVNLADVIATAVETSRPLIDAAGHMLEVSAPPECVLLDADSMRLAQVFSNLLNNAAKYTDPGGRITITVECEEDVAEVAIADNGVGIPGGALDRIFDMFSQADASDRRAQTGLGIGLTIARRLVEMHGGEVRAESEGPGCGSRFTVRLPRALGDRPRVEAVRTAIAASLALPRVMVVDDNRDSANTMGAILKKLGAEVCVVHSGSAALEAYGDFRPAVVFLDIGMPEMDGYEVARRIRERPGAAAATLVALTGWGQDRDRSRTTAAGFQHHLVKPAELGALRAVLSSVAS
jgi:signal transduction histidine kinase